MEVMMKKLDTTFWGARPLFKILDAEGKGQTRFVGGCVRDALLGRAVGDVDLATELLPQKVVALLEAAGVRAVPTGIAHGTITARLQGRSFEITTLRVDVQTDGRHARVAFTRDWEADARRRDFTINALYADLDGTIYDPTNGVADAVAGRVRFIGDPHARIREDYLRILRFFRFYATHGKTLNPEGCAACVQLRDGIKTLSAERVREELFKIFAAPKGVKALEVMKTQKILPCVLPVPVSVESYKRLGERLGSTGDALLCLGALLDGNGAREVAAHLQLSKKQKRRLQNMQERPCGFSAQWDETHARQALYWRGRQAFEDQVFLEGAKWLSVLDWEPPLFPISGADVESAGVVGRRVGKILKNLEHWWVKKGFVKKDDVMRQLRKIIQED